MSPAIIADSLTPPQCHSSGQPVVRKPATCASSPVHRPNDLSPQWHPEGQRCDPLGAGQARARFGGRASYERTTAHAADALVSFGITGDLARKMTFPALYRLAAAGRLDCPIIGVASDDWTMDHLVDWCEKASSWPTKP